MDTDIDFEKIQSNWEMFEKLCGRLSIEGLNNLVSELGERVCMCPSSTRVDQYGAYQGGLVDHALQVTSVMRTLNTALEYELPLSSILKVGLLHDIGKIGDLTKRYFIEQDSSWHREKLGQMFKYNEALNKMSVSHRTLWLLQHFSVEVSGDEWLAIQLAQGSHFEENRFYVGHEPTLALLLQHAKSVVIHNNKNADV